ncbi:hypothetical protein [uncultured Clostridium sp.]|uniref:hypothetical protein n=1 Tax=uncultured Clostridium sp. TaxID=59620 RepID=UPI0025DB9BB8|nr:hypothetical protein [uncultured Clostridium sp.]
MSYAKRYKEEVKIFNDISRKFDNLVEEDIIGAFELQKESIQAYNRWSHIKYEIKKELKRGEAVATKERLEEMCIYLKHIHTVSKSVWLKAKEDLRII